MGERTEIIKLDVSTDTRLDRLEEVERDHERRIAVLEADKVAPSFITTNAKWIIAGIVVVTLAFLGWTANDIKSLISYTPQAEVVS
jgi:hypothetical protein